MSYVAMFDSGKDPLVQFLNSTRKIFGLSDGMLMGSVAST